MIILMHLYNELLEYTTHWTLFTFEILKYRFTLTVKFSSQ